MMDDRSYRILIVDDDPEMVSYLTELLTAHGYSVVAAHTGEDSLAAMRAGSPSLLSPAGIDLVILDVRIPEPDGYEVCRRAKADETLRYIPIIMVTALGSKQHVTRGLEIGADDYVTKPFSPEELLARVQAMLRIRQMEREVLRHNRELAALNAIASVVSRSLDLEEVLPATLETIMSLLEMHAGVVCLLDSESKQLVMQSQQGFSTIGAHTPLVFDVIDSYHQRSVGGCTYYVTHPGGRNYKELPINENVAESRCLARFQKMGHTPGKCRVSAMEINPDFPYTLDLRLKIV